MVFYKKTQNGQNTKRMSSLVMYLHANVNDDDNVSLLNEFKCKTRLSKNQETLTLIRGRVGDNSVFSSLNLLGERKLYVSCMSGFCIIKNLSNFRFSCDTGDI